MGLFTKKDSDGLPKTIRELYVESESRKAYKDKAYKIRCYEKQYRIGKDMFVAGKLDIDPVGNYSIDTLMESLQRCTKGT